MGFTFSLVPAAINVQLCLHYLTLTSGVGGGLISHTAPVFYVECELLLIAFLTNYL